MDRCEYRVVLLAIAVTYLAAGSRRNVVTGTDVSASSSCRLRESEQRSRDCMDVFINQLEAVRLSRHKFFTGVDVEIIRSVCQWFRTAVSCIQDVRTRCPSAPLESHIEDLLKPYLSLIGLCSKDDFYEEYALNQNCFLNARAHSEGCYTNFRSRADDLVDEITLATVTATDHERRHTAIHQYCSQLKHLTQCIKNDVRKCHRTAGRLVEVLVDASVELSPLCADETIRRTHATQSTTTTQSRVHPYDVTATSDGTPSLPYRRGPQALMHAGFWTSLAVAVIVAALT